MADSGGRDQLQSLSGFTQRDILARLRDEANHFRARGGGCVRAQSLTEFLEFGGSNPSFARVEEENRIDGAIGIGPKLALVLGCPKFEINRAWQFLGLKTRRWVNFVAVLRNVRLGKNKIAFAILRFVFRLGSE